MTKLAIDATFTQNPNLNGFDDQAKRIAKEHFKCGWVAKVSNKGHLILHAPDGVTTAALARDTSSPHARGNAEAPLKKWRKMNAQPVPQLVDGEYVCETCGEKFKKRMQIVGHRVSNHSTPRVCMVCGRDFNTPGGYSAHLKGHKETLLGPRNEAGELIALAKPTRPTKPAPAPAPSPKPKPVAELEFKTNDDEPLEIAKETPVPTLAITPKPAVEKAVIQSPPRDVQVRKNLEEMPTSDLVEYAMGLVEVIQVLGKRTGELQARMDMITEVTKM
ncbi:hypothetical protein PXH69_24075 [Rhodococcus qingshengii]|uniref:C2H2-type domain-containing protein n=1 Tax=Rhodococcus qingshengii TaxID=334542 RepID=A0AAW6LSW7_RHOSG|nr:hypothetical protein [Rhodococcus qingshengii]MDE8648060.1 hypothetical protein [Rhodococcus qingshengii]